MTRLKSYLDRIELANYDTQFLVTDCTDGTVELYLEHENSSTDVAECFGNFTQDEISELARLLYGRYVRKVPLYTETHTFDA